MVTTPEHSFIEFSTDLEDCGCNTILEIADASDLCFPVIVTGSNVSVSITNVSGDIITKVKDLPGALNQSVQWLTLELDLSEYLACGECFRVLISIGKKRYYSNVIVYNRDTKRLLTSFRSRINTYFPFIEDVWYSLRLPIELINQNPKTETEEYIDANGYIHNTFKTRRDVYDLNVDYTSVSFHKKLQVMFMHDVIIDDIQVSETGDYQINYEESIQEGKIQLYKASTEVSEQDILLMRNY